MLSAEDNDLVTQIEGKAPCGNLLRNYWHPLALTEELTASRAAKAVKIMGEDLVLFRDETGGYGLIDRRCPHRGAGLCFGFCGSETAPATLCSGGASRAGF